MKLPVRTTLLTGLLWYTLAGTARAVVIDTFSGAQSVTSNSGSTINASSASHASILGGERDLWVQWILGPGAVSVNIDDAGSGLASSVTNTDTFGKANFQWDGPDGSSTLNETGLGGVDLTAGGTLGAIAVQVLSSNQNFTLLITVYTDATHGSNTSSVLVPGPVASPQTFIYPFSSFSDFGASHGATFSNVGAITMFLVAPINSVQLGIVESTIVPEPSSLLLAVLGLVGLLRWKR